MPDWVRRAELFLAVVEYESEREFVGC